MINESKKRESSPLAHLGRSGIGRRIEVAAEPSPRSKADVQGLREEISKIKPKGKRPKGKRGPKKGFGGRPRKQGEVSKRTQDRRMADEK